MVSLERYYDIVNRYNKKVKLYKVRPRGNPASVLRAMRFIRGMHKRTWCEHCKNVGTVELHHLNGWKDYRIHQLIFLCKKCHLNYHREERMLARKWNATAVQKLRTEINTTIQKKGVTKDAAFDIVAKKRGLGASHIQKLYYGVKAPSKKNIESRATLTAAEAVNFWRNMTEWGITING